MFPLAAVLLLFVLSASQAQRQEKDWTKLTLSTGAIRGRKYVTERNATGYLFHGVPYAEPPLGDLRYRSPVDKKPWKGELDTTTYKYACMTARKFDINILNARPINEDCLHVNVFTAEKCLVEKNCPVIYYIYGGQWNNNNPFMFPDDLLIDNYQARGIILVTVGYRLGTLAFFNTGKRSSAVKNLGLLGENCFLKRVM
jgi:carboxylesterase type B